MWISMWMAGVLSVLGTTQQAESVFLGEYDSNWGPVALEQHGDQITGVYSCCGGGTIRGVRNGDLIEYEWEQTGAQGRGWWRVVADGERLEGPWGFCEYFDDGGLWLLFRPYPLNGSRKTSADQLNAVLREYPRTGPRHRGQHGGHRHEAFEIHPTDADVGAAADGTGPGPDVSSRSKQADNES
jgi:hypothetical protein